MGKKAEAAATLKAVVAEADIIWSCLRDKEAVLDVYGHLLSLDGLEGKLLVDSSTIPGRDVNELAERLGRAGADFVAMPGKFTSHTIHLHALLDAILMCDRCSHG